MNIILTAIVMWLAATMGLPANFEHPRIQFVAPAQMQAVLEHGRSTSETPGAAGESASAAPRNAGFDVVALYDDTRRTIYLARSWSVTSPADMSVLVHEMVHHLQNVAGLQYECAQAREEPAYIAQDKWLALFGKNLVDEFKLDALTVKLRTTCID
jgi:hypothetical protein